MKLAPYIHFAGNAEEALNFYAETLNANIIAVQRYGDTPVDAGEDYKQKITHARLQIGDYEIMISDVFKGQPVSTGGNIHLSLEVEDEDQMENIFNKMAEGGIVTMPLQIAFWGAKFGMLRDKFGINWMFDHELKK